MELTYSETEKIVEMKYTATSATGSTFSPGVYKISDKILMLESLLPDDVQIKYYN